MQTIEFVNATLENTGSVGSTDITIIISLIISIVAAFIASVTLYYAHLRGMSISLHAKCELPELSGGDFRMDVPTALPVKVNLLMLNSGNRAGIVKDLKLEFNPQQDFKEFYRDTWVERDSIQSIDKSLDSTITIKNQDTNLVIFNGYILLDWGIDMSHLGNIDIKSNNLKTLFKKMPKYKKEKLKKFINFLTENKKLGDFIISYSYTKPKFISRRITFKNDAIPLEVGHLYKRTIKCYEDSHKRHQISTHPKEIIRGILKGIEVLEEVLDGCRNKIENHPKEDIFSLGLNSSLIESILRNEDEDFKLLSKCTNYRKTIEEDVKPLLNELLGFDQKMQTTSASSTKKIIPSLKEEIEEEKENLGKKLKEISPKLEELKKEIESE